MEHHVIIIPGLGNGVAKHEWATNRWKYYGIIPHVFDARWIVEEPNFDNKLKRAINLVDSFAKSNKRVSLVGNSAGSSFVFNIFGKRKKSIHRVIINCGRIRTGDWPWFTFDQATATSPSFRESVLMAEKTECTLSKADRAKILTLRPLFDEIVPPSTVSIEGAKNIVIPSIEHMLTISLNMTLLDRRVVDFILAPL